MKTRKGVVFITIGGISLVLTILIGVALFVMSQEGRIAEHKIRRMRMFFAAQAGVVDALERIRRSQFGGNYSLDIGAGLDYYPPAGHPFNPNGGYRVRILDRCDGADNVGACNNPVAPLTGPFGTTHLSVTVLQ